MEVKADASMGTVMRYLKLFIIAAVVQAAAAHGDDRLAAVPTENDSMSTVQPVTRARISSVSLSEPSDCPAGNIQGSNCSSNVRLSQEISADQAPENARPSVFGDLSSNGHGRWTEMIAGMAQYALGRFMESALHDEVRAVPWYAAAARNGESAAQFRLGLMYGQGRGGLPRDLIQASRLLHAAAEKGHVDAQGNLGLNYLLGQGVHQSLKYAYMWISLASDVRGGSSVRTKEMIARAMPKDQLPEAQQLARRCKERGFLQCEDEMR